jgi:hypothetical protein
VPVQTVALVLRFKWQVIGSMALTRALLTFLGLLFLSVGKCEHSTVQHILPSVSSQLMKTNEGNATQITIVKAQMQKRKIIVDWKLTNDCPGIIQQYKSKIWCTKSGANEVESNFNAPYNCQSGNITAPSISFKRPKNKNCSRGAQLHIMVGMHRRK